MSRRMRVLGALLAVAAAALASEDDASAFVHVVTHGETLAQLAMRVYGTPRFETALVGANALDSHGGSAVVAGQPLEVPAPGHARVKDGDTWPELARVHLGDARRAETLARANGGVSWVPPAEGQEIEIPAVVAHIVSDGETMSTLAARYLGDLNRGWELEAYNNRLTDGGPSHLARGDVVLVPLLELSLTAEGKREARAAANRTLSEGGGQAFEAQRRAGAEIPPILADLRAGRYVDVVAKANRLLGSGELSHPQLAAVNRALVEAYVALEAPGLAAGACAAWKENLLEPLRLSPRTTSPKVRAACAAR